MYETGQALDPRAVTLWRLQRVLRLVIVGIPTAIALGFGAGMLVGAAAGAVIGMGVVAFQLVLAIVWPALYYSTFRYTVREDDLLVQSGVLFRRWSAIPHNRIQHVDTRQGPIERSLGLARLMIFTAAGMIADGSIPGLAEADAEQLRDELARRGGDDGV